MNGLPLTSLEEARAAIDALRDADRIVRRVGAMVIPAPPIVVHVV